MSSTSPYQKDRSKNEKAGSQNEKAAPWLVLRHVEHEHIGTLAQLLRKSGIAVRYADLFHGDAVPKDAAGIGGLIVMGGPMGVYESATYPFLEQEQALIRRCAEEGPPVLGICLGAQLIAAALGAKVYAGPQKEIGWHRLSLAAPEDAWTAGLPSEFMGFHWHGDTFDLPQGTKSLFRSALYENQGFRHGENVLALQFHFEVNARMINEWLDDDGCRAELRAAGVEAKDVRRETQKWSARLEELSRRIFGNFLGGFAGKTDLTTEDAENTERQARPAKTGAKK
jgi:GMP synthase (glutamine-hydrolysing)